MVMDDENCAALSVHLYSSGNPDATYLVAGLLHGHPGSVRMALIQGIGDAAPAPEVGRVLTEIGLDVRAWEPQLISTPPATPVDVGLTICVPT